MTARHGVRVWLALVTVYLVWGSTFIALAIAIRDLPPFLAMSVRHLIAGTVLLVFALPRGDRMTLDTPVSPSKCMLLAAGPVRRLPPKDLSWPFASAR